MNDVEVKDLIEKAHQSLEAAKLLFDEGFIDFSAWLFPDQKNLHW